MPFGRSRNVLSHASLARPKCSIATKESAPHTTAQRDRTRTFVRGCSRERSIRGSATLAKYSRSDAVVISSSVALDLFLLMQRFDHARADLSIPFVHVSHMLTHDHVWHISARWLRPASAIRST